MCICTAILLLESLCAELIFCRCTIARAHCTDCCLAAILRPSTVVLLQQLRSFCSSLQHTM